MAAEMKVTDAVAREMAGEFMTRLYQAISFEPNDHAIACMRIVAEKYLAAMLEPVGCLSTYGDEQTEQDKPAAIFPMASMLAGDTIVYRIRGPE